MAALLTGGVALVVVLTHSASTYRVSAVFDQVPGLIDGGEVRAGGVKVGHVERIELGPGGYPRVTMRVSSDYRLHRGASANLRALSVAGEASRYVALTSGDGPALPDGAVLGRNRTDQPVEFDQVLSSLDPGTRRDLQRVFARLDRATVGRGPEVERTLRRSAPSLSATADLLAALRSDGRSLRALVSRGHRVARAVADQPSSLGLFADRLTGLLGTTAARQAELGEMVRLMAPGFRSTRAAVDRLHSSVSDLRTLVRVARPGVDELIPFSRDLRPLLRAARPAVREGAALVRGGPSDLRQLDRLLQTAQPVLRSAAPALRSANPMLDQARVRLPDFFSFFSGWGDFTANYDANGHGGRVGLVYAPPPTNEIGSSSAAPGRLRIPYLRDPGVLEAEPWRGYEESFVGGGERP